MAITRKVLAEPLKNITNRRTNTKKSTLNEIEQHVLDSHTSLDQNEISSLSGYKREIENYFESLDTDTVFVEKDISFDMRSELINWIIACHERLGLIDDTLYFCIFIIDKFLNNRSLSPNKLELVGITALFIAAKIEEVVCPDLDSFVLLLRNNFSAQDLKKAEKYLLFSLNYDLTFNNPLFFLRRASKANNYDSKSRKMAKYFLELMTLERDFYSFKKSVLSTTAMYLARKICQSDVNKNLFFYYAKLEKSDIKECFDLLVRLIYQEPKFLNLEAKYSKGENLQVNLLARTFAKTYFY